VLLSRLQDAGVGCYLGPWFVGALAYADDIVLLTPTAHVMRKMLTLRDDFADEYCVQFNAKKSKCIYFGASKASSLFHHRTEFDVCENKIDNVNSWPHLGHGINSDLNYAKNIQSQCRSMIGQINNIFVYFRS
jgi:hypothetical protein